MIASFELAGAPGCVVLVERPALPEPGDIEYGFLQCAAAQPTLHRRSSFGRVVADTAARAGVERLIAIRNPRLVLDEALGARLRQAIERLAALPVDFSIASAGGMTPTDGRVCSLYSSQTPFIPLSPDPEPLVDPMPDMWIADATYLREVCSKSNALCDCGMETVVAIRGWMDGRIALSAPELSGAIDGPLLPRDANRVKVALQEGLAPDFAGETIATLLGPITLDALPPKPRHRDCQGLDAAVETVLAKSSDPLSLSIVTRTRFERPHLLDRLLTSISRARNDAPLEIVLATDVEPELARSRTKDLQNRFINLDIRLAVSADAEKPSRVANLLLGIRSSRNEYVVILDDDDYVDLFAFESISQARFLGARPLIIANSEVHDETWITTSRGRHVLGASSHRQMWPADGWRRIFGGSNTLPVCAMIMPRERLLQRVDGFEFCHDLSEDFALFLLVLTDPQLPRIAELNGTFGHISVRGGQENSITADDRRGWVRDVSSYLADLTGAKEVTGPGTWQLLADNSGPAKAIADSALRQARADIANRDRQIRLLENQIARLGTAAARGVAA